MTGGAGPDIEVSRHPPEGPSGPPPGPVPAVPRRRTRGWSVALLSLPVLVVVSAVAGLAFRSASDDLHEARREVVQSRERLRDLDAARAEASATRKQAERRNASLRKVLRQAQAARKGEAADLAAARRSLAVLTQDVASSGAGEKQGDVHLQSLQKCLDGVSLALNRIAVGDLGGARDTLLVIDADCRSAESSAAPA